MVARAPTRQTRPHPRELRPKTVNKRGGLFVFFIRQSALRFRIDFLSDPEFLKRKFIYCFRLMHDVHASALLIVRYFINSTAVLVVRSAAGCVCTMSRGIIHDMEKHFRSGPSALTNEPCGTRRTTAVCGSIVLKASGAQNRRLTSRRKSANR